MIKKYDKDKDEIDKIIEDKPKFYEPVKNDDSVFVDIIKQNLVEILEVGQVTDSRQQYSLVEETLYKLIPMVDDVNKKIIGEYFMDQKKLKVSINDKQKELQVLMDEYGSNVKNVYENFIKKL